MTKDNTMIDRVAAAIQGASVNQPWSYENAARAAIAAMREPTEAMADAAIWHPEINDVDYIIANRIWQAMIDAAIAEGVM